MRRRAQLHSARRPRGGWLCPVRSRGRSHPGRVRRRQPRRRAGARRRGARASTRTATGCRLPGAPATAARAPARRDRHPARGRLSLDRAQVPAAGQPRPTARRDRGVRAVSLSAAGARSTACRRDPRQLRDRAPLRARARDHARPWAGAGGDAGRAQRRSSTRSTTRPRPSTRPRCSPCSSRTSRGLPTLLSDEPVPAELGPTAASRSPAGGDAGARSRSSSACSDVPVVEVETRLRRGDRGALRAGSRCASCPATSCSSRVSSARGRRPSCAARAAHSASRAA